MSERIIYQVQDLHKHYGQDEILGGITLAFYDDAKIGVIGRNGAGKSTLMNIIAGLDTKFEGIAKPADEDVTIGILSQEPKLNDELDVKGNLREAVAHLLEIEAKYDEVCQDMEGREDEYETLTEQMGHYDIWDLESRLVQAAGALCLPPFDADVKVLSGGERRRVALCKLLLRQPDILLLDEPTNHLDADTVEWLEHHLKEYKGMVMLITHDRYFLDNVVNWMLEVDRGKGIPYEGNYTTFLEAKSKKLSSQKQTEARIEKTYKRELEWVRQTPAARRGRSKARMSRFSELQNSRAGAQLESPDFRIPPGPRLGDKVVVVDKLSKGYGDRTLIQDLSFEVRPGAIVGVIGANGMGKSTLMKMIMGMEEPDSGTIDIGSTVEMTFVDQSRAVIDDELSVYDNITEGNVQLPFDGKVIDGRAFVARFNFKGEDQQKLLKHCSGGMRNRVVLAKMLKEPANLIILDEPTNDLDLETLRVLEEAIEDYRGSMIVVSHDRYFLNRICTDILAFEGDGKIFFHKEGDYESWHEWRDNNRDKMGLSKESNAGKYAKLLRE
ncbi:MAG: sulfate-transporting ATPase [Planctomycetota bacterium]|jgi:sulfate-transporting ATPase